MTFLFDKEFPINKKPSLCGYCLSSGKGFYLHLNDKIYASCSYEHLEKIKLRVKNKEEIKITTEINPQSVKKVIEEFKPTYLKYSKKNNSFVMHEWSAEDKEKFFERFVVLYLSLEDKLAREGA